MPDDLTFGYVIQPVPRGFPDDVMGDPARATAALMEANEAGIRAARPHFDTVWAEDHFMWETRPVLEAITVLSYLIGRHEGMRFGHLVLGQSYRNPALTAKMAAIMQVLSHGRFILGIGAGWKKDEYRAYGYSYPPDAERVEELEEAAQIVKALWTQSPATFQGQHYSIENAECVPRPDPAIPLMIGGAGEKLTLRVVAKYADWWNAPFIKADKLAHKQRVLEGYCREYGRDPAEIVHTFYGLVSLVDDPSQVVKRDVDVVGGTADMVLKELEEYVKLGVKHFQFRFLDFPEMRGLEMFIEKVLPRLRAL